MEDLTNYLPVVAYEVLIIDVKMISEAEPSDPAVYRIGTTILDYSQPGAGSAVDPGFCVQDNAGNVFLVLSLDYDNINVSDIFRCGYGPVSDKVGVVYKPTADGNSLFISPIKYNHLDKSAIDIERPKELESLSRKKFTYTAFASDSLGTDFTLVNDENLPYMAVLTSAVEITNPVISNFEGLWREGGVLKLNITAIEDTKELTGFVDGSNIDVSYNWTDRTITLTGNLDYYWRGRKKTLISPWVSSVHDAVVGIYFLYTADGETFAWSQTPWMFSECMVAFVNYKVTAAMSFAVAETHGTGDGDWHEGQHNLNGTYLDPKTGGGKATAGTYILNTATDAANTPGFDQALLRDEDKSTVVPVWIQGTYTTMYIGSALAAMFDVAATLPFTAAGSYLQVNDPLTGAMIDGINNRFYNVYQILIPVSSDVNSQKFRMIMLQPQAAFTSQALAESEEANGLNLGELNNISPEFKIYARLTYGTLAGNGNTGKCTLKSITYVAGTKVRSFNIGGFIPTDHAVLSNLGWVGSGHTGTANKIAGFGASGEAIYVDASTIPQEITGLTLLSTGWTLVSGFYEYDLANANITATSSVDIIPAKANIAIVKAADIMPETLSSNGSVKLYAINAPTGNIGVTIIITEVS